MQLCNHSLIHNHDLLRYLVNWLSLEDIWKLRRIDKKTKQIIEIDSCNSSDKFIKNIISLKINDYLYLIIIHDNQLFSLNVLQIIPDFMKIQEVEDYPDNNKYLELKTTKTIKYCMLHKNNEIHEIHNIIYIPDMFKEQYEFVINLHNACAIKNDKISYYK
jgi:hypothetical protein